MTVCGSSRLSGGYGSLTAFMFPRSHTLARALWSKIIAVDNHLTSRWQVFLFLSDGYYHRHFVCTRLYPSLERYKRLQVTSRYRIHSELASRTENHWLRVDRWYLYPRSGHA